MKPATCTSKYIYRILTHCYIFRLWPPSWDSHTNLNLMGYGTICGAKIPVERLCTEKYGIHNIRPDTKYLSSCSLCNICTNSTWQKGKYSLYMTKFCETEASVLKFHVYLATSINIPRCQSETERTHFNRNSYKRSLSQPVWSLFVCTARSNITQHFAWWIWIQLLFVREISCEGIVCQIKYTPTCISEVEFSTISPAKRWTVSKSQL
jgi:hypothetical protein